MLHRTRAMLSTLAVSLLWPFLLIPMLASWLLSSTDDGDDETDTDDGDDQDGDDDEHGDGDEDEDELDAAALAAENAKLKRALERLRKRRPAKPDPKKPADTTDDEAATAAVAKANDRLIRAEARTQLAAAGIPKDRLRRAVRLLEEDLADVEVDDDGEVDEDAVEAAIEALREDWPELFTSRGDDELEDEPKGKKPRPKVNTGPGTGTGKGAKKELSVAEKLLAQAGLR